MKIGVEGKVKRVVEWRRRGGGNKRWSGRVFVGERRRAGAVPFKTLQQASRDPKSRGHTPKRDPLFGSTPDYPS